MRRTTRLAPWIAIAITWFGAEAALAEPAAVLDALLDGNRTTLDLDELAARVPLEDGEAFRVVEIGRDAHTSHHAVAIRHAETPHRHVRYDLFVVMLRGHGTMRQGGETRPVGVGSVLYVPRDTVHAFTNESDEPAIAYAVYAPAFDGKDRVEVDSAVDR